MPSTGLGIVYPASTDHTRMWEHLQATAESVDDLFDRCGVKMHHTQSIVSNTPTNILWGTEDEDTHGFHSGASATVTIPAGKGGIYAITFGVLFTGLSTSGSRQLGSIVITSAVTGGHLDIYRDRTDILDDRLVVSVTLPLLAGDSFTCDAFHIQTTNLNVTNHLSCYRVAR